SAVQTSWERLLSNQGRSFLEHSFTKKLLRHCAVLVHCKFPGPKARGSSSSKVDMCRALPSVITISKSPPQNSAITWRHTPQGAHSSAGSCPALPPTMAMALKSRLPSFTARKKAVRSAQQVAVNPAFSMLHPAYTVPSAHSRAAPTANPE